MSSSIVKSFVGGMKPVVDYCNKTDVQIELQNETLANVEWSIMLGAPEVLTIGAHFIKAHQGRRALDIGTFTGASALAWALAVPENGEVYTYDVSLDNYKKHGLPILQKDPETLKKIKAFEGPAIEYLDKLLAAGQKNTFDFAFIDADKENYPHYYDRCVQLLRPGGVILVDNSLYFGKVLNLQDYSDERAKAIDVCNHAIFADDRTLSFLINCGDGLHVAFKM